VLHLINIEKHANKKQASILCVHPHSPQKETLKGKKSKSHNNKNNTPPYNNTPPNYQSTTTLLT